MRISACYIVKNEAMQLKHSIESVQPYVDELIVVDTGSTDESRQIAGHLGAVVYDFPWQDDFSAARNHALGKATGDWIVFLDADEYFIDSTGGNIRQVIEANQSADVLLLAMQNIGVEADDLLDIHVPRIFRHREGLRYQGRIHEELRLHGEAVARVRSIPSEQLQLIHTGYQEIDIKGKAQRNLSLLKKAMAEADDPSVYYAYMAETYDGLGDEGKAMEYAQLDIARGRQMVTYASRSYRILLRILMNYPARHQERRQVAEKAVQDFSELPDFHAELAECLAIDLEFAAAVSEAVQALTVCHEYAGVEPTEFTDEDARMLRRRQQLWQGYCMSAEQIRITACLIVRDEEKDIGVWLENAQNYADELIVVDTGSKDRTAEIAREMGASVFEFTWQDDFAAARNFALKQATGQWITMLDADERFDHPERVRSYLATLAAEDRYDAIMTMIVHIDEDDADREIQHTPYLRILRNGRNMYYEGRVHEQLTKPSGQLAIITDVKHLNILHTGYSARRIQAKVKRNLALLQTEIQEHGEKPEYFRYLAESYFGLGNYPAAWTYIQKAISADVSSYGAQSDLYYRGAQCQWELDFPLAEKLQFLDQASELFPASAEFPALLGEQLYETGEKGLGAAYLKKALALAESGMITTIESSHFSEISDRIYALYGIWMLEQDAVEAAVESFKKALALNAFNEMAWDGLCQLYFSQQYPSLLQDIEEEDAVHHGIKAFISRMAERHGWMCLWEKYDGQKYRESYYRQLKQHQLPVLYDEVISQLTIDIRRLVMLLLRTEKVETLQYAGLRRQLQDELPESMEQNWKAFCGMNSVVSKDAFKVMLPVVVRYGDTEQQIRFGRLAAQVSEPFLWETCEQFYAVKHYSEALALYQLFPMDSSMVTDEFWLHTGICFFHMGEWATAAECLEQASGIERDTYLKWCEEKQDG